MTKEEHATRALARIIAIASDAILDPDTSEALKADLQDIIIEASRVYSATTGAVPATGA